MGQRMENIKRKKSFSMPFKNIISLVLAFMMIWGVLPFEGLVAYADENGDFDKDIKMTAMQVNTIFERETESNEIKVVKESVDIRGGKFISTDYTIKGVSISQVDESGDLVVYIGTKNFVIEDEGTISITLNDNASIESNKNYKIELNYDYKDKDGKNITGSVESNKFKINNKPNIVKLDKTELFLGDEIIIEGTGLKGAQLRFKKGSTKSENMVKANENDAKIIGQLKEEKNVVTGKNDIIIESYNGDEGLPSATATLLNAVQISLETTFEVSKITPKAGPNSGGNEVKIIGKGFSDIDEVKFDGKIAKIVTLEDTENNEEKILIVEAPKSQNTGPVTVSINGKDIGYTYTYLAGGNNLIVTDISPKLGDMLGGDLITIEGYNFQLTKTEGSGDDRKSVSDEDKGKVDSKLLTFEKDVSKEEEGFKRPDDEVILRKREVRVTVGGENAEFKLNKSGEINVSDLNTLTNIELNTGKQSLKILTPSIGAIQEDTIVDLVVEVITKFYDAEENEIEDYRITERESKEFTYETIKDPDVTKEGVTPTIGSTADVIDVTTPNNIEEIKEGINFPTVAIKGEKFLVQSKVDENGERIIKRPEVFVVPSYAKVSDEEIKSKIGDKDYEYRAKVKEVSLMAGGDVVDVDGIFNKLATKIVAEFPAYPHSQEGVTDIVIVNPDGGFLRITDAFIYKRPETKPEILEIKPMKVDANGGKKITIETRGVDPLVEDIIVTIDGELAKVENLEKIIKDDENRELITIVAPQGKAGLKTVQIINKDGGTATSDISKEETPEGEANKKLYYTRVTSEPNITLIAPNYGGAGAKVTIKGSGFTRTELDEDGKEILNSGTRVWFGSHEIKNDISYGENRLGEDTEGEIKIVDTSTIELILPSGLPIGYKDVRVENPDTAYDEVKKGYNYLEPQTRPEIINISPDYGTIHGGTIIKIEGQRFTEDVEVYFGEKKGLNPVVNADGTEVRVETPAYPIDSDNIDKINVDLTIVNYDGGQVTGGFEYRVPGSTPIISKIDPASGTTSGNQTVIITGRDFRFKKANENEDKYNYEDGDEIPKVYFGGEEVTSVKYAGASQLIVTTPAYPKAERVDVTIVNPDTGTVTSKGGFTYQQSALTINNIIPSTINRYGGTNITVKGSGFIKGEFKNKLTKKNIDLEVIFGNETERKTIIGGYTEVKVGDIEVIYNMQDSDNPKISIESSIDKKEFEGRIDSSNPLMVELMTLEVEFPEEGMKELSEAIKISIEGNDLIVTRRTAIEVEWVDEETINILTPVMDGIGERDIIVRNKDGGEAKGTVEVKSPDSKPKITRVFKDSKEGEYEEIDGVKSRVLYLNINGENLIDIEGDDFRKPVTIHIEDIKITEDINYYPKDESKSNKVTFTMPRVDDKYANGKEYAIVLENEDGGLANSKGANPPVYIKFFKGESQPVISGIAPNFGFSKGGTMVTIEGKDFRKNMVNYSETLRVYFGDGLDQVEATDIISIDHNKIQLRTPPHNPGTVTVKVQNPDESTTKLDNAFTYLSNPKITSIIDPTDPDEKAPITTVSILGEQEIKLKGAGFMEGAEVHFTPKITDDLEADGRTIYIEGKAYILEESIEGTDYEWINNETITIKTPKSKTDNFGVIIINPDGGASPIYTDLTYGLPEIAAPSWIAAELVYDRFIRVHWGPVSGASEYEIHVVTNETTIELVGSTQLTSFAYNDIEPNTSYRFIVKALGDFGSSKPSMESNTVRTGKVVGPPDEDGGLSEDTSISKTGNVANVVIGSKDRGTGTMQIDLTKGNLAGSKDLVISLPASVITDSRYRNIQVIGKDFTLEFQASAFDLASIRENSRRTDAGVRFKISPYSDNTEVALGNQLSTVYNLEASAYVGKTNTPMDYLAGSMNFILDYDVQKANLRRLNSRSLQYFDLGKNSWQPLQRSSQTMGHSLAATVNRLGRYTIIGRR